jgi:superfamily I DNA/RNA helicase
MEENTVKVLTIHAAKGLERLKVIVIGNKYYNDEEIRISYVAATRAMDELYIMKPKPKYKKKQYSSWE